MSRQTDEVAANLLDQLQITDDLFVADTPSTEMTDDQSNARTSLKMPPQASAVSRQPVAENLEPTLAKVGGFSALLDHLKSETLRHNHASKAFRSAA